MKKAFSVISNFSKEAIDILKSNNIDLAIDDSDNIPNTEEIICIYSDNDPYVPKEDAEEFANRVNSEKIIINNAGHFNEKFGYTEFKELLKYL